jgi:predicted nucleic acid-binding protein
MFHRMTIITARELAGYGLRLEPTGYVVLPITEVIAERARDVQIRMAARGHHRAAGVIDLITAAVAEHHGAVVLHYDADFEHIAAVTGQLQAWVAPRGDLA